MHRRLHWSGGLGDIGAPVARPVHEAQDEPHRQQHHHHEELAVESDVHSISVSYFDFLRDGCGAPFFDTRARDFGASSKFCASCCSAERSRAVFSLAEALFASFFWRDLILVWLLCMRMR